MGAWGFKAWENDGALDWKGDFNSKLRIVSRLKRAIKSKHTDEARAATEWLIRADKAGIMHPFDMEELAPVAVNSLRKIKKDLADPQIWAYGSKKKIPDKEMKRIKEAIRKTNIDIERQIRYMKKFEK